MQTQIHKQGVEQREGSVFNTLGGLLPPESKHLASQCKLIRGDIIDSKLRQQSFEKKLKMNLNGPVHHSLSLSLKDIKHTHKKKLFMQPCSSHVLSGNIMMKVSLM